MTAVPVAGVPAGAWGGITWSKLRLVSGLILFSFAALHFWNHALGLWSLEAMEAARDVRVAVTRSLPGTAVLVAAALLHGALGMAKFIRTRTRRIGLRNLVQLAFGLLIPLWLIRHVWDLRGAEELFGFETNYHYALWGLYPIEAVNLAVLMGLVWGHGCIGVHRWLAFRPWYRRTLWLWQAIAILTPALAFAGFVTAARALKAAKLYRNPFQPGEFDILVANIEAWETGYLVLLGAAFALWAGLVVAGRLRPRVAVRYAGGAVVQAPRGMTLLEISRANRVPHASVCGGRARCSTCRVRVLEGAGDLPEATETEAQVLRRVGAPDNVRLACQLRPVKDLTVSTLMPAGMEAGRGVPLDRYLWGVEQEVTLLFADMRGFTKMSEGKLPFDTVFILNQFLGRLAEAIQDSGGFVDKFMGDGIMAIFGMETSTETGARQAIAAARAMGGVLAGLNQSLRDEIGQPLAMGIGVHTGPAILGRIGAAHRGDAAPRITALGETVNLASRLESLTKELGVEAVVSDASMTAAGVMPGEGIDRHAAVVRGLTAPVAVWAARRAVDLPESR
jgi:adenylate cyclase